MSPVLYQACKVLLTVVAKVYFGLRVEGAEHVPSCGPVVLAANHASYLDPPLIGIATPRPVRYIGKQELFFFPLSVLFRALGGIPIARGSGDAGAFRAAARILRQGGVVVMFPEGTRTPDGALQQPQEGLGLLAANCPVPIVPTIIHGSYRALPRGRWLPAPVPLRVEFGPPLMPAEYQSLLSSRQGRRQLVMQVMTEIQRRYQSPAVPLSDHATARNECVEQKGD